MSWWWRTKPRSILRTIQWFPFFGSLENKNWNEKDPFSKSMKGGSTVHPIRRAYIYNAHSEDDDSIGSLSFQQYLTGENDKKETESNGRNDKTTYEFFGFGFVEKSGIIKVTNVGKRIMQGIFDDEDFLKQMLKLHFPNNINPKISGFSDGDYVYPFQLICLAVNEFKYLNRSEIALLFGCTNVERVDKAFEAIKSFREQYDILPNKNKKKEVVSICENCFKSAYDKLDNSIDTYYEYAEALTRCLVYTGLFKTSGRSIATKIRVPDYSAKKLDMIINEISFEHKEFKDVSSYMEWFGATDNIVLPWESVSSRKDIIADKLKYIKELDKNEELSNIYDEQLTDSINCTIEQAKKQAKSTSVSVLKDTENFLTDFITGLKEQQYIKFVSQTKDARKEILDKYDEILQTIDMGALWLEVNTWKSLLAIKGEKQVKRNFKIEEDLSPKSFAPGIGNTPDMEMYTDNYIIIPEVSLMTGVQQWEHEASSVIDHVLSFIKANEEKKVLGIFISTSINIRTKWQFFILNKESWVEKPVPVIPLTIKQYKQIIEQFYKYNLNVSEFINVITQINQIALQKQNYKDWLEETDNYIKSWVDSASSIT